MGRQGITVVTVTKPFIAASMPSLSFPVPGHLLLGRQEQKLRNYWAFSFSKCHKKVRKGDFE